MSHGSHRKPDAAEVKRVAAGRWTSILPAVAPIDSAILDERHHPCPKCGGTDRFRYLNSESGALFCNQCFNERNGDGFAAVAWLNECSFPEAVRTVADFLNLSDNESHRGHNGTAPKDKAVSKGIRYESASSAIAALMRSHGPPAGQWTYSDKNGETVAFVVRFNKTDGGKEFRPVSRHEGGWYIKAPSTPRPLYGLRDVATVSTVYVCEGEKAVDAARTLGIFAVTSMSGSKSPALTDWTPLVGKKVVILPDNDEPGRMYADTVAGILRDHNSSASVKIVALPDLPASGDIVEWIEGNGDAAEPDAMRRELEALVDKAELISPDSPEPSTERFKPFPVDALPEPIRSFVIAGAKSIGCDPCFVAAFLLPVLASAIGNSRRLRLKRRWMVPSVLWTAIVGESGSSKSPAFQLAKRLIDKRHERSIREYEVAVLKHEQDLLRYEQQRDEWKRKKGESGDPPLKPEPPAPRRYIVNDATAEALAPILAANPRGVLNACDELKSWSGSFDRYASGKGSDLPRWLSMYNGEGFTIDRKTGLQRTIFVRRNAVSVMGGIQPAILRSAMGQENRAAGLAARLLVVYPPRKAKRWTEADIDEQLESQLSEIVDRLYDLEMTTDEDCEFVPLTIEPTPEAKALFIEYYNAHNQEQSDLDGDLAAAWSKLEEVAARLALIIHFVREVAERPGPHCAGTIDCDSMRMAIQLTEWFKGEARRVYAMLDESESDGDQRKLVEWIERRGGSVSARELQQGNRRYKSSTAAETALDELAKAGLGDWTPISPTALGGRPSRRLVLRSSTQPAESSGK